MPSRVMDAGEVLAGPGAQLRLVTLDDCTPRYQGWLADPQVNRFLETRWRAQTLPDIRAFVTAMLASETDYLFAIVDPADGTHVGNIKLGPVNWTHRFADVSYFVGERDRWGRGLASQAIRLAAAFGFERLDLNRVQAGLYASNVGSARALERAGFRREGVWRQQLRGAEGWEDHVWFGQLRDEWQGSAP
jgi:RimJ/RimL family protein N-acetyltransferase